MKTSLKGILAILDEEAVVLSTYKDSKGVLTIGVGHTAAAGGFAVETIVVEAEGLCASCRAADA